MAEPVPPQQHSEAPQRLKLPEEQLLQHGERLFRREGRRLTEGRQHPDGQRQQRAPRLLK